MRTSKPRNLSDRVAKLMLIFSVLGSAWMYGVLSHRNDLFPYPQIRAIARSASAGWALITERSGLIIPWWYVENMDQIERAVIHMPEAVADGLVLATGVGPDNYFVTRVVDNQGGIVHAWDLDWFRLWPDSTHLDEETRPKSRPGPSVHGVLLMPNGDLVFNFERAGLVRLDYCGDVIWRLPYRTHHSVVLDDSGSFWVGGERNYRVQPIPFPNHEPPFDEMTMLEVAPHGEILTEISVSELLIDNGLSGLLYLSNINGWDTTVSGDTLHMNDVEPFPANLNEGLFERDDIMISLRNINAILVFNKETRKVKYLNVGSVVRQHDPDFIDGNTISVFDNNNLSGSQGGARTDHAGLASRIILINALTDETSVVFEGSAQTPFFTDIMGKHQWLPNRNILITEARSGSAFEITEDGQLVWEYHNTLREGLLGLLVGAHKLPSSMDREYFARLEAGCRPK